MPPGIFTLFFTGNDMYTVTDNQKHKETKNKNQYKQQTVKIDMSSLQISKLLDACYKITFLTTLKYIKNIQNIFRVQEQRTCRKTYF